MALERIQSDSFYRKCFDALPSKASHPLDHETLWQTCDRMGKEMGLPGPSRDFIQEVLGALGVPTDVTWAANEVVDFVQQCFVCCYAHETPEDWGEPVPARVLSPNQRKAFSPSVARTVSRLQGRAARLSQPFDAVLPAAHTEGSEDDFGDYLLEVSRRTGYPVGAFLDYEALKEVHIIPIMETKIAEGHTHASQSEIFAEELAKQMAAIRTTFEAEHQQLTAEIRQLLTKVRLLRRGAACWWDHQTPARITTKARHSTPHRTVPLLQRCLLQ